MRPIEGGRRAPDQLRPPRGEAERPGAVDDLSGSPGTAGPPPPASGPPGCRLDAAGQARPGATDPLSQVVLESPPRGWFEVGRLGGLEDGRRIRVLAGEHDVAVFLVDGRLLAIGNRCPHAGAPLSEGLLAGDVVTCPLHAWRFHLVTGRCPDVPGARVPIYDARIEGERVLVRI